MRKTLLIAAATLAAGVIASQAQGVYSQNIVGYVNVSIGAGFNAIANPLDSSNNSLTNLIPGIVTGAYDGSAIYVWTGTSYTQYYVDSTQGGLNDFGDNGNVPSPNIDPGTAIFISANAANTVTFVGTVHTDGVGASTNVIGVTTNLLQGTKFIASKLPIAGGINTVLGVPTSTGQLDGAAIYVPNIINGNLNGFNSYYVDSTYGGTGIADFGDNGLVPEPTIPVGSGFFLSFPGSVKWVQSL